MLCGVDAVWGVAVFSSGPATVEWLFNGRVHSTASNQTSGTISLPLSGKPSNAGTWRARITNSSGVQLSSQCVVRVHLASAPRVTRQPVQVASVVLGNALELSAEGG